MSNIHPELARLEAESKRSHRRFQTLFLVLAFVMFGFQMFLLGISVSDGKTENIVSNGILALFWALAIAIQWHSKKLDLEMENMTRDLERMEKLAEFAKELADLAEPKKSHQDELTEILMAIIDDVTGGNRPPTADEIPKVEAAFHESTDDHYVKLTLVEGGMEVEISRQPFDVPGRSAAHDAARERGEKARTKINVVDGDAPEVKPPTKSQQRRANVKKGLGPLTDEEVREQRNAARRAKRAANKAAATTTTTTTQPGQTKLV